MRAAVLLLCLILGCAAGRNVPQPTTRPAASAAPPAPGRVLCLNRCLDREAAKAKAAPGVLLVLVMGDEVYGETYVAPDLARGRMDPADLMRMVSAANPGCVIALSVFRPAVTV